MTGAVPDILARIVEHKRWELRQSPAPLSSLEVQAEQAVRTRRDFIRALKAKPVAIIAEAKKASPSKGVLSEDFRPADIARQYESGGAAAVSVLTDQHFFQGSLEELETARSAITLPVLRKDFLIEESQVIEAAAAGADAVLLIAALLDTNRLQRFRELAAQYEMASLVEVHDREELRAAVDSGAQMIGVNNRNLHTFQVTLDTSLQLAEHMPAAALAVSESGIETTAQIARLQQAGYSAFLIGEHLMRSGDPTQALRNLTCS